MMEFFFRTKTYDSTIDSMVVGILLVDFAAMAVAVGIVWIAIKVDAVSSIVVETLFDLSQTWLTNHLDFVNDFQELK